MMLLRLIMVINFCIFNLGSLHAAVVPKLPLRAFAHPCHQTFTDLGRPVIALVLFGLEKQEAMTLQALKELPKEVTIALRNSRGELSRWLEQFRLKGHEILITVPMEPYGYPVNDPGKDSLLTRLSAGENQERLRQALKNVQGVVGVTHDQGGAFTASPEALMPIMDVLHSEGLLIFDPLVSTKSVVTDIAKEKDVPWAVPDKFFGGDLKDLDEEFGALEHIAQEKGYVIVSASVTPVFLDRLVQWIKALETKNFILGPLSAVVQ